jgi:hypothetical protein
MLVKTGFHTKSIGLNLKVFVRKLKQDGPLISKQACEKSN